jgi:hypothetical protein
MSRITTPEGIVYDVAPDGSWGVDVERSDLDAMERMAGQHGLNERIFRGSACPTEDESMEPSDSSRPVRAGVCDERHRRIDETLSRLDARLDAHASDHRDQETQRRNDVRWILGMFAAILTGLAISVLSSWIVPPAVP